MKNSVPCALFAFSASLTAQLIILCARSGGKTAESGFSELIRYTPSDIIHNRNDLVKRNDASAVRGK